MSSGCPGSHSSECARRTFFLCSERNRLGHISGPGYFLLLGFSFGVVLTGRISDPRPLQNLAVAEQVAYASRNQPHTNQRTSLSSLQIYVKNARKSIVEPVLSALEPMSDTENEDLSRKPSIRSYIHAYRARPTYASSGLTVASRPRDNTGQVIWRSNVKEENTDALVSIEAQDEVPTIGKSLSHYASPSPPPLPPPISKPATSKTRRPKIKSKSRAPVSSPTSIPQKSVKPEGKADSYKQAWSVSEQDLLERLLEEIPDGSKNRYALQPYSTTHAYPANTFDQVETDIVSHEWTQDTETGCQSRAEIFRKVEAIWPVDRSTGRCR